MTQYAYFDSTVPAPSPVLGWYDTSVHDYPTLPPSIDLLQLADDDQSRFSGPWAVANGVLVAYTPPALVLTPAQQAIAALGQGLTIVSTSTPALNGRYAVDPSTCNNIQAEMLSLLVTGNFADGSATVPWPTTSPNDARTFDIPQFRSFALAIAAYVATLYKVINGSVTTLPPATATIP